MSEALSAHDLQQLITRVFEPQPSDTGLAVITDLPDARWPDHPDWRARRELAAEWAAKLETVRESLGLSRATMAWYRNAGGNNADLPESCVTTPPGEALHAADDLAETAEAGDNDRVSVVLHFIHRGRGRLIQVRGDEPVVKHH